VLATAGPRDDVVLGLVTRRSRSTRADLQPADYMEDMKGDMSGGGAVIEMSNRRSGHAAPVPAVVLHREHAGRRLYRPGDIVTAMNGRSR
jgi:leucyl aminopeptidase